MTAFSTAALAENGIVHDRFDACGDWAMMDQAFHEYASGSLPEPYHLGMELLPQLTLLGIDMSDRHYRIRTVGDFVSRAVGCAIEAGRVELAIEWLEQGRSIIWGQLLDLRTPLDILKESHSALAQELRQLSLEIEQMGSWARRALPSALMGHAQQDPSKLATSSYELVQRRQELLDVIRNLPGFETFLRPKPLADLRIAARSGPVVILAEGDREESYHALILRPRQEDKVISLKLNAFTRKTAHRLLTMLNCTLQQSGRIYSSDNAQTASTVEESSQQNTGSIRSTTMHFRDVPTGFLGRLRDASNTLLKPSERHLKPAVAASSTADEAFGSILSELWEHVAKPVLDALAISVRLIM
jgi:hypothetical protein